MTASSRQMEGSAVPTSRTGPLGRLHWIVAEVIAIYRPLLARRVVR